MQRCTYEAWTGSLYPSRDGAYIAHQQYEEAQAEIARLRAAVDHWKGAATARHPNPADHRYWEGRYRDEAAEVERLRADAASWASLSVALEGDRRSAWNDAIEAAQAIATAAAKRANDTAMMHAWDSDSRSRMFARAREAAAIAAEIGALKPDGGNIEKINNAPEAAPTGEIGQTSIPASTLRPSCTAQEISREAAIADRIEAQVQATRVAMAQLGLTDNDLRTLDALTSHFLTIAHDLRVGFAVTEMGKPISPQA